MVQADVDPPVPPAPAGLTDRIFAKAFALLTLNTKAALKFLREAEFTAKVVSDVRVLAFV